MTDTSWVQQFLTIPFASGGRDYNGADCWGLTRLALIYLTGKELPSYADAYENALDSEQTSHVIVNGALAIATPVDHPQIGDVCVMKTYGRICHVALYIGNDRILHTDSDTGPCTPRIDDIMIKGRIVRWYHVN